MERYSLDAAFELLQAFDYTADADDFIEVTTWYNGEGYEVTTRHKNQEQRFGLTIGMFKALKKLIKKLDK